MPRSDKRKIISVLLITDTERVQRIFQDLENEGRLQLRTAATLTQGDLDLSESAPGFIFAQSRISGFSSDLALGRLKKSLTSATRIVLLAVDEADAAQAKKQGKPFLDLSSEDQELSQGVRDLLAHPEAAEPKKGAKGTTPAKAKAAPATKAKGTATESKAAPAAETNGVTGTKTKAAPAGKKPAPKRKAPPVTGGAVVKEAEAVAILPPPEAPVIEVEAAKEEGAAAEAPAPPVTREKASEDHAAVPRTRRQRKEEPPFPIQGEKFEEPSLPLQEAAESEPIVPLPQWIAEGIPADLPTEAGAKKSPQEPSPEAAAAEEKEFPSFAEMMQRAEVKGKAAAEEPLPEPPDIMDFRAPTEHRGQEEAEPFSNGMTRAANKRAPWLLPLAVVVAVVLVPIVWYTAGELAPKKTVKPLPHEAKPVHPVAAPVPKAAPAAVPAAPVATAPRAVPTLAPVAPQKGPAQAPTKAPAPAAAPARSPAATRPPSPQPAKAAPVVPAQAAKPAVKAGLKALPPFMAGARLDPAYGRSHHGWQRFIGARAEYKVYREGDLFRAIQVIALKGEAIPEEIYRKALLEFGGIDSYQIQSTDRKGNYVVERGVAKGGIGLTVYRKNTDLSMKGLVIYYP